MQQLGFQFSDPDPWAAWAARPLTPETRLEDIIMQIKRDVAVLAGDLSYYSGEGDREFYEARIAAMQAEAGGIDEFMGQ